MTTSLAYTRTGPLDHNKTKGVATLSKTYLHCMFTKLMLFSVFSFMNVLFVFTFILIVNAFVKKAVHIFIFFGHWALLGSVLSSI